MASLSVLIFSLLLLCLHGQYLSIRPQNPEFECIDIYKQSSLQHPQLKNHQIQLKPSDEVLAMLSNDVTSEKLSNDESVPEFDVPKEGCPNGQIPIYKPRNSNYTENHFHPNSYGKIGQHAAFIHKSEDNPWRGASAWISVYEPKVTKDQLSMVLLWLENENNSERNTIQFGWAVHPQLYGDHRTRLTAYWTTGNNDNGCYNILCRGFIQIHKRIFLGAPFKNISVVGGQQYNTRLAITQDPKTHNWLLTNGKSYIGYWPGELLPYLAEGAKEVRYGGFTLARTKNLKSDKIVSPPMGNGNKPEDFEVDLKHTCYMHFVKYVTHDFQNVDIGFNVIDDKADNMDCYDVNYFGNYRSQHRQTFTFGGPGGLCDV